MNAVVSQDKLQVQHSEQLIMTIAAGLDQAHNCMAADQ